MHDRCTQRASRIDACAAAPRRLASAKELRRDNAATLVGAHRAPYGPQPWLSRPRTVGPAAGAQGCPRPSQPTCDQARRRRRHKKNAADGQVSVRGLTPRCAVSAGSTTRPGASSRVQFPDTG
jgi:hypothetical protein